MTNQSPWSIKGIKPSNRDAVKEQAFKHGLTIGEYVNSLIEEAETRVVTRNTPIYTPVFDPNFQIPPAPQNYAQTHNQAYAQELNPFPQMMNSDTSRLALAMEALNKKLDNVANANQVFRPNDGANSALRTDIDNAERVAERAIASLLKRVEDDNNKNSQNFYQISSTLQDVKQAQETIGERLRKIEHENPNHRAIDSLRTLEESLSRLAIQIAQTDDRTQELAKKIETVGQSRLSPQDVEKILDGGLNVVNEKIDQRLDEVNGRLSSIEEIATLSIEQTDKGISLLSERVKDQEVINSRTTESVKDALVDLSARITQIEGQATDVVKDALDERFVGLVNRIEQIDHSVENFVLNARRELEAKFSDLSRELTEKIENGEKDTIEAIENIGDQLVKTAQTLDERVRSLEEVNDNAKDHGLAMRIELGRITHAIDARLSAIENQGSDIGDKAGEHITRLAQQVTNQLRLAEEKTNDFVNKMANENRALLDSLNNSRSEQMLEIESKFSNFDQKFSQKLDEKIGLINLEIKSSEDRAKAVSAPLHRSIEQVLDRLDTIESRGLGSYSEVISAPNSQNMISPQPIENGFVDLNKTDFDDGIKDFGDDFDGAQLPEKDLLLQDDGFVSDLNTELSIDDTFSDSLFGFDDGENSDGENSWLNDNSANQNSNKQDSSYLENARRAAIEAAYNPVESKKKKEKKPASQKAKAPIINEENLFDNTIIETNPEKTSKSKAAKQNNKTGGLSPIGKVAAGTLVLATLSTGYVYLSQHKKPDQSELPQALKTAPNTQPSNAVTAAPPTNVSAPPANIAPPTIGDTNISNTIGAPVVDKASPQKPQVALPPTIGPQNKTTPPTPPIAPNAAIAKPQAAMPQAPVRIAGITNGAQPQPQALKVDARSLYDAALAKQKAGDMGAYTKLLSQSADSGDTRAQNRLAKMYEKGDGVSKNMNEARKWTERAAQAGSRQAQHNLGVYYAEGDGAPQDFVKAAQNFNKAARRGLTDSQFNLGAMHEQGLGTAKSPTDAYYWYSLAAKSGDADAVRKSKEVASKLNAADKAALDRKIASFRAETGGQE